MMVLILLTASFIGLVCYSRLLAFGQAKLDEVSLRLVSESSEAQAVDALHAAAFGDSSPLGQPLAYGPCSLSHEGLIDFRASRYKASAMSVVGVNIPHDSLMSMAEVGAEGREETLVLIGLLLGFLVVASVLLMVTGGRLAPWIRAGDPWSSLREVGGRL